MTDQTFTLKEGSAALIIEQDLTVLTAFSSNEKPVYLNSLFILAINELIAQDNQTFMELIGDVINNYNLTLPPVN